MPVEDLIRYFNLADTAGEATLYAVGEQVAAWHAGRTLASRFAPVVELRREGIVGHRAVLDIRDAQGNPVTGDPAAVCESEAAMVHFDRLCRTLHALNFLAQQRSTGGFLQVPVHPRHIRAVPNQHGLVYEAILKRCGLAPEDIVLELDADALDTLPETALASYRQRGYRLALRLGDSPLALPAALAFKPDMLILALADRGMVAAAHAAGTAVVLADVAHGADYRNALQDEVDLAYGPLLGEPAPFCRPTHKVVRNPYNSATSPFERP